SAQLQGDEPYRIFFDWGKPGLTRDGTATLDEVAVAYQRLKPSRIEIGAHTDRSGSETVNLATSRRRGNEAKTYLAAHGIPAKVMAVFAFGERRPIVPTGGGGRE